MPSHRDCRSRVCIIRFKKSKDMRELTVEYWTLIEAHIIEGLDRYDNRLPTSLCSTCSRVLREYRNGVFNRHITVFDYSTILSGRETRRSTNSSNCSCLVCDIALSIPRNIATKTGCASLPTSLVGRPPKNLDVGAHTQPVAIKVCSYCLTTLLKGKSHVCNKSTRLENVEQYLNRASPNFKEKVAISVIKEKRSSSDGATSSIVLSNAKGRPMVLSSPTSPTLKSPAFVLWCIASEVHSSWPQDLQM